MVQNVENCRKHIRYKSSVEAVNFVHVCLQSAIITIYLSGTIKEWKVKLQSKETVGRDGGQGKWKTKEDGIKQLVKFQNYILKG